MIVPIYGSIMLSLEKINSAFVILNQQVYYHEFLWQNTSLDKSGLFRTNGSKPKRSCVYLLYSKEENMSFLLT